MVDTAKDKPKNKLVKIAVVSSVIVAAVIITIIVIPIIQSKIDEDNRIKALLEVYGVLDERCVAECNNYNFLDFEYDGFCDNVQDFCFITQCPSGFKCLETVECKFGEQSC